MRAVAAVVLAVVVALAGCTAPVHDVGSAGSRTPSPAADPGGVDDGRDDAGGVADGVAVDADIDVNQSDGLSDAELARYVNRTMARVEQLRGLEFEKRVPVEVTSREAYRESVGDRGLAGPRAAWTNQQWEATFAVGEDTDAVAVHNDVYGGRVLGYYSPSADRIVIISGGNRTVVPNGTLAHELVHALQDQHDLSAGGSTLDGRLAAQGLTEGVARYVETLYVRRCGVEWDCVATPAGAGGGGGGRVNLAMLFTVLHPYADGPAFVDRLRERGGWAAVSAAYESPPAATARIIHPNWRGPPADVTVTDATGDGWHRFARGADTLGEAAIYVMLWYAASHHRADTGVGVGDPFDADGAFDQYDYDASPSAGWAGDRLVAYRNGDRFGYAWATEWESAADAREFRESYLAILRSHGANQIGRDTWVVPKGAYADAFRVTRDGTRVTVVNAPTPAELDDVHARDG